jgi:hypothetical protein
MNAMANVAQSMVWLADAKSSNSMLISSHPVLNTETGRS